MNIGHFCVVHTEYTYKIDFLNLFSKIMKIIFEKNSIGKKEQGFNSRTSFEYSQKLCASKKSEHAFRKNLK